MTEREERPEPFDPYANPISDDDEAEMVAEARALHEIVQDESRWDAYIEGWVQDRRAGHRRLGLPAPTAAEEEIERALAREFFENERAEPFQSAYWIPVEFW